MNKIEEFIEEKEYDLNLEASVNFKKPEEYLRMVILFANGDNIGYIIFGVHPKNNKILGIKKVKRSYQEISKNIKLHIKPRIEPIIKIACIEEKNVILVKIKPGEEKPYYYVKEAL